MGSAKGVNLWKAKAKKLTEAIVLNNNWGPKQHREFLVMALAGEVGELCGLVKDEMRGDVIPKLAMIYEAVDAYVFLRAIETNLGISLDYYANLKMTEVFKRPLMKKAMADAARKRRRMAAAKQRRGKTVVMGD